MAVKQGSNDAAIYHPFECQMVRLRRISRDEFITADKTLNLEAFFVCGTASKADQVRSKLIL